MITFHKKHIPLVAVLFIGVVGVLNLFGGATAYAATRTWTGGGDGTTFSDSANWSGGVPAAGDTLVLPAVSADSVSMTNDSGVSFAALVLQSSSVAASGTTSYTIDTLSLQNNATITASVISGQKRALLNAASEIIGVGNLTVSGSIAINGVFTVAGNVTVGVAGGDSGRLIPSSGSDITGDLIINNNSVHYTDNYGDPARYVINAGGQLIIDPNAGSVTAPIVFNGARSLLNVPRSHDCDGSPLSYFDPCGTAVNRTISVAVTLNSDALVFAPGGVTVNFTGTLTTNGHTITPVKLLDGSVRVNGTPVGPSAVTTLLSSTANVTRLFVGQNETFRLDAATTTGQLTAFDGATITGEGTVYTLIITQNAALIPGNSPGKVTVLFGFVSWGTLQLELQNTTAYDQLIVGESYSGGGNSVTLSGDLELSLYDGWGFRQGDVLTIIDNRHSSAISGTFAGLPEGSQITVGAMRFSISYVGGDGNDVTLTALDTGGILPPNTGVMRMIMANPVVPIGMGIVTAVLIAVLLVRRRARV